MDSIDELKLIRESQGGNSKSFKVLIEYYQAAMYRTALGIVKDHELAKDVVQDGFIKVWTKLDSFNSNHRFFSWLYKIIINESLNSLRNKKNYEEYSNQESNSENPYLTLINKEENKRLLKSIADLPEIYRVVIHLRHFEDMSYKDMAEILEVDEKTVKSRLYSARTRLRDVLYQ